MLDMYNRGFIFLSMIFLSIPLIFSADTLSCSFTRSACDNDEERLFYSYSDISSNVRLNDNNILPNYSYSLCCKSSVSFGGGLNFYNIDPTIQSCGGDSTIFHFTDSTNSRISKTYDPLHHSYTLCANVPDTFSELRVKWVEDKSEEPWYETSSYSCLFKSNDNVNGNVGSCDSIEYDFSVWGLLVEKVDNLNCNVDCTSKLDNRVYSSCSQKVKECSNVNPVCDGSLYGSWISVSDTKEVQCSAPWDVTRDKVFSDTQVNVESVSVVCEDIIKIEYVVLLNNEHVTMSIYVCGG